ATVLRRLALLSHVFNVCRLEWHFESLVNPVEAISKPAPNNARDRRVAPAPAPERSECDDESSERRASDDELDLVINASDSAVLRDAVRFAVETAMRRGELTSLLWQ